MAAKNELKFAVALLILSVNVACSSVTVGSRHGEQHTLWKQSTPEAQGMNSAQLMDLLNYVEKQGRPLDSILVIRNGSTVLEQYYHGYAPNTKHILNSCTKSFVSALVGIAIDQRYLKR